MDLGKNISFQVIWKGNLSSLMCHVYCQVINYIIPNDISPPTTAIAILLSCYHKPTTLTRMFELQQCALRLLSFIFFQVFCLLWYFAIFPTSLVYRFNTYIHDLQRLINTVSCLLSRDSFSFCHSQKQAPSFFAKR